jgi:rhodanese-related sulfurtransferase
MFGSQVPAVDATEVDEDAHLLDVREEVEWVAGHAPGAQHVPMSQIQARLDEVPTDRGVVVVCRSGNRSARVVQFLLANGWREVRNLDGGMQDWVAVGRPLVADHGQPAEVL